MSSSNMRRLCGFITCIAIFSAAVSETVDVQNGENITLDVATPGVGKVRRVTVGQCETGRGDVIFRYCSPEEMAAGCTVNNPERFSIHIDTARLSLTIIDARASDDGCYVVEVIGERNVTKLQTNVKVNGVSRVPSIETPWTDGHISTISLEHLWLIAGVITIGILVVYSIIVIIINCGSQKKIQNNSDAGNNTFRTTQLLLSDNNGAGKPDTEESSETVDETNMLRDNGNWRSKKDLNHGA